MATQQTPDQHTTTWPELAIGLYDRLTGRNAEITYEFDNARIHVPSGTGPQAQHAEWKVDGTIRIRTRDASSSAPN
ncbi:MAG: hypothetical protein AAFX79_05865 [Planctomycetota bacterium]